jgi:hypothetical protein
MAKCEIQHQIKSLELKFSMFDLETSLLLILHYEAQFELQTLS